MELEASTTSNVPASPAFIRALQVERLLQTRPDIAPILAANSSFNIQAPLLDSIIKNAPVLAPATRLPDSFSIVSLDYGRITLSDARRLFLWEVGTELSSSFSDDHIQVMAAQSGAPAIDESGRLLIPATLRRRLGITDKGQVLVVTDSQPVAHVRIYSLQTLHKSLTNR